MLMPRPLHLAAVLALVGSAAADFTIRDGKLAVLSSAGTTKASVSFSSSDLPEKPLKSLSVDALDTLRLTFSLSNDGESPVVPAQSMVLAKGSDSGRSWNGLVKVRAGGRARWELDMSRAPTTLLNVSPSGKVQVDLLLADFGDSHKPLRIPLADVTFPSDLVLPYPYWNTEDNKPPAGLEWEKYALEEELHWTFKGGEKPVNPVISLAFTGVALSPWIFLLGAWSKIAQDGRSSGFALLSSPSPATLLFLLCLAAQELLIFTYWTSLRLYQYLPAAGALAVPLVLTGRSALSQLRVRRAQKPIGGSKAAAAAAVGKTKKLE